MIEPQCEGGTDRCGDLNYRTLSPDCSRQVIVLLGGRRELAQHVALADSCQLLHMPSTDFQELRMTHPSPGVSRSGVTALDMSHRTGQPVEYPVTYLVTKIMTQDRYDDK